MPLIEGIWADEVEVDAPVTRSGHVVTQNLLYASFKTMAEQTFCSMDHHVIETLSCGNIAQAYHKRE